MRGFARRACGFAASVALVATTAAIDVDPKSCDPRVTEIQSAALEAQLLAVKAGEAIAKQAGPGEPETLAISMARSLFGNDPGDAALRLKTINGECQDLVREISKVLRADRPIRTVPESWGVGSPHDRRILWRQLRRIFEYKRWLDRYPYKEASSELQVLRGERSTCVQSGRRRRALPEGLERSQAEGNPPHPGTAPSPGGGPYHPG
jgi:hypothetical protein